MLKETTLSRMATLLKVELAVLKAAITAPEEQDIAIDEKIAVYSETDLAARDRNKYNEGKTAGTEMLVKDIKKKNAIEIDGDDIDKVIAALSDKVKKDAQANPDARVVDLETKVNQWKEKYAEAEGKLTAAQQRQAAAALDAELLSHFPKNRVSTLSDSEYLTVLKANLNITEKDGKRIVQRDGKTLEDPKSLEPLPLKDVVNNYFNERTWIDSKESGGAVAGGPAGGGGGNSRVGGGTGKFTKISEVHKHLEEQNINPNGEKGQAFIKTASKENPDLDYNS